MAFPLTFELDGEEKSHRSIIFCARRTFRLDVVMFGALVRWPQRPRLKNRPQELPETPKRSMSWLGCLH